MTPKGGGRAPEPAAGSELTVEELVRYSRQVRLPEIGEAGQARLKSARVAIVGLGGLGSPAAIYLAAAGVGTLGIIDGDVVDASNLHRQVLYGVSDVGRWKVDAARAQLARLNPAVEVVAHAERVTSANALELLRGWDVVVDGTDNFPTRYLVNDATVLLGVPNVHGSVLRFEGRLSVFGAANGPCYRCLFPEPPPAGSVPDCATAGVIGVGPGLVGVLQAVETIKWITGAGSGLVGRLLLVDLLQARFETVAVSRDPACPVCGTRTQRALVDYDALCGLPAAGAVEWLTPAALAERLLASRPVQLVDVRQPWEWSIAHLPNAVLVPLDELGERLARLDRDVDTVVYCHHGARSLAGAELLRAAGFARVSHLDGGIERWRAERDPAMARY